MQQLTYDELYKYIQSYIPEGVLDYLPLKVCELESFDQNLFEERIKAATVKEVPLLPMQIYFKTNEVKEERIAEGIQHTIKTLLAIKKYEEYEILPAVFIAAYLNEIISIDSELERDVVEGATLSLVKLQSIIVCAEEHLRKQKYGYWPFGERTYLPNTPIFADEYFYILNEMSEAIKYKRAVDLNNIAKRIVKTFIDALSEKEIIIYRYSKECMDKALRIVKSKVNDDSERCYSVRETPSIKTKEPFIYTYHNIFNDEIKPKITPHIFNDIKTTHKNSIENSLNENIDWPAQMKEKYNKFNEAIYNTQMQILKVILKENGLKDPEIDDEILSINQNLLNTSETWEEWKQNLKIVLNKIIAKG